MPEGAMALRLMQAEEGGAAGAATVLVDGTRLTRGGAAFVNAEMILAGGKWDTFRMLTHPGSAILPAALAAAESARRPGGSTWWPSRLVTKSWSAWRPTSSRASWPAASTLDRCLASLARRLRRPSCWV